MLACRRWFLLLLIALLPIQGMAAFAMPWRDGGTPAPQAQATTTHCDTGAATDPDAKHAAGAKQAPNHGSCLDCGHCAACFPPLVATPPAHPPTPGMPPLPQAQRLTSADPGSPFRPPISL
ncbi:hypothetical protein GCM10007860_27790 [Chitiniphilus shinanonensis]|uniref:DUF2946 domain-containing protein n=1 Tax=Chitiniphilus shinanonensis TaxID=553088 RepID=A0ABQ6BVZ7_9NEIS|nr:hypothetical protein [Chitiniphilus shinanonensis]GLS05622.1 hypothetical protein GCM10007860_27790 [Chitiniphilus shinanonensis]